MLWWVIQNTAIAALLAGCVGLACRCLRMAPVGRHALWLIIMIKLVTPPMVAWPWQVRDPFFGAKSALTAAQASTAPQITTIRPPSLATPQPPETKQRQTPVAEIDAVMADADVDDQLPPASHSVSTPPPPPIIAARRIESSPAIPWRTWRIAAVAIWLLGALIFTIVQSIRIVRMARLIRRAKPAPGELVRQAGDMARRLRVTPIPICVVPKIVSPAIWALGRPVMLWPDGLCAGACESATSGLLVHELAHVRRRDHWVGWLELLAGCAWWWNPLFWYVRHQIRENAELACDAWVVDVLPRGRRAYAEALLAVCEYFTGQAVAAPAVGARTGGRRLLERRLAMILRDTFPLRLGKYRLLAVGLIGLITLPVLSQRAPDALQPQPGGQPAGVRTPGATDVWVDGGGALNTGGVALTPLHDYGGVASALPPIAQEAIARYQAEKAMAEREMAARVSNSRDNAIRQLEELLPMLDQAGATPQAQAVRQMIQRLQAEGGVVHQALPDPGDLTAYRDRVGHRFFFAVTGSDQGRIWGSTVYSDDSPLAVAVVHAGLLKVGQSGIVRVTILPGMESYDGSSRNGVVSEAYGPWEGSYLVQAVPSEPAAGEIRLHSPGPGTLRQQGPYWRVVPGTPGSSDVGPAVPGGLPSRPGMGGSGALPGGAGTAPQSPSAYPGNSGATNNDTYQLQPSPAPAVPSTAAVPPGTTPSGSSTGPVTSPAVPPPAPEAIAPGGEEVGAGLAVGDKFMISLTGSTTGTIWGDKIYTADSSLATAAVHAGVLKDGELGKIIVTILPGQDGYDGATHNGVTSEPWHSFGRSFKVEKAPDHGTRFGGYGPGGAR